MARDWLLLEAFPEPETARLRFYDWSEPAFTFGYGQKWQAVKGAGLGAGEFIRRPTGGGLVDHRADWTYALVLPPGHPLAAARACESYRMVHEALAEALRSIGLDGRLQDEACQSAIVGGASSRKLVAACFEQAERFDIVREDDGRKIAGAAQKRTKRGLLFQGSVDRRAVGELKNWGKLAESFAQKLGVMLGARPKHYSEKPWAAAMVAETTARFAAKEWNEKR